MEFNRIFFWRSGAVTIVLLLFCHHVSTPGTYLYEALPGTVTHGAAAVLEILAAVARLPVWLASTRVAWPFTRVLVLAYRLVHWLLISPLLLPFASLLSIPAVSLHAHFVRLPDWAKWTLMAAAGALGGSVALVSTVVIFVKSAFKPDKNAAPLQPRRWLRRRQEDLQQLVPIKHRRIPRMQREAGEEAFPPLPSVPKLTKPFLIEYDSHLRGDEMRGWLWIVLGSDFDGSFCKGWPPPAEGPDDPAQRWYCTLRLGGDEGRVGEGAGGESDRKEATATKKPQLGPTLVLSEAHHAQQGAPGTSKADVVVDLSGCLVHVYRSGPMKDAYLFQKKGPLVIEHPTRTLLGSERSLCLYAYNAALKEQWYRALQTALEKDRLRNLGNPPSPGLPPAPVSPTRGSWIGTDGAAPDPATLESDLPAWFTKYLVHLAEMHPGYYPAVGSKGGQAAGERPAGPAGAPATTASAPPHEERPLAPRVDPIGHSQSMPPDLKAARADASGAAGGHVSTGTEPGPLPSGYVTPAAHVARASPQRFTFGLRRIPGIKRWFDGAPSAPNTPPDAAQQQRAGATPDGAQTGSAVAASPESAAKAAKVAPPNAESPGAPPSRPPAGAMHPGLRRLGSPLGHGPRGRFARDASAPDLTALRWRGGGGGAGANGGSGEVASGKGPESSTTVEGREDSGTRQRMMDRFGLETPESLPALPRSAKGQGLRLDVERLVLERETQSGLGESEPSGRSLASARALLSRFTGVVRAIESRYASVEQMLFRALRLPVGQAISGSEDASEGSADDDNTDRESPTPLGSELLGRGRKSGLWGSLGGSPKSMSSKLPRPSTGAAIGGGPTSESGSFEGVSEEHLVALDHELDQLWFGGDAPEELAEGGEKSRRRHRRSHSRGSYGASSSQAGAGRGIAHRRAMSGLPLGTDKQASELVLQVNERLERFCREQDRPGPGPFETPSPLQSRLPGGATVLNMLAARMWFDIMRSERIERGLQSFFQKQLDKVPLPPYVGGLSLVTLKVGSSSPVFSNCEVLPYGGLKLRMKVRYTGDMRLAIETKLDLRETGAWSTFDRLLNVLHGHKAGDGMADMEALDPVAEVEAEGSAEAQGDDVGPGQPPNQHAMSRMLGRLTSLLQGRPIRRMAANQARRIGNMISSNIGKLPLSLSASLDHLEGNLVIWVPPPPTERLWYGFEPSPVLELNCTPLVDGLPLKNKLVSRRISSFFRRRLTHLIFSNFVLPNCEGIRLPGLIPDPSDELRRAPPPPRTPQAHPRAASTMPAMRRAQRAVDSSSDESDMSDDIPLTPPTWPRLAPDAAQRRAAARAMGKGPILTAAGDRRGPNAAQNVGPASPGPGVPQRSSGSGRAMPGLRHQSSSGISLSPLRIGDPRHAVNEETGGFFSPENSDTDGDGASSLLRAPGIVSGANRPPSGACHSEPITFVPNRDGAGRGEGSSGDGALPESWGRAAMVDMLRGALGESDGRDRHGELELETPSETTVLRGSRGQSGGQRGWSMDSVRQRTPGVTPGVALLAQPRRLEDEMTPVHKISEENR